MKLYYSPGACSLAVHIALREAGLPFSLAKVDLARHELSEPENGSDDFYTVSPRGYVPMLQLDDGSRHTEAASLLQYVADLAPGKALLPAAGVTPVQPRAVEAAAMSLRLRSQPHPTGGSRRPHSSAKYFSFTASVCAP